MNILSNYFYLALNLTKNGWKQRNFKGNASSNPLLEGKKCDNQTVPAEGEKLFSQISQEELDEVTHKVAMSQFSFARALARVLNGGQDQKELKKIIIAESIKELEYLV